MSDSDDTLTRFQERYEEGRVPWDDPLPPPEIIELAGALPPGRALDAGCGYGRAAIYLAERGWEAVGIDFVPAAIEEARRRAVMAGVEGEAGGAGRAEFYVASAAALPFLTPPFDLVIDIGCMHSFSDEMLLAYRGELVRLLRPGGLVVLFAHLGDETAEVNDGPRGIPETTIHALFEGLFTLERVERGVTQVEDRPPWNSGWFWFRRR